MKQTSVFPLKAELEETKFGELWFNHNYVRHTCVKEFLDSNFKGTVSDKKNLQVTLGIKKNTFQSQHFPFFSKKLHNFDRKTALHKISLRRH